MTDTVYTALQLITRGRGEGLSVVALGRTTGYDQKACWHIVRQLLDLNLVVKLRRAGVGTNFCVHRYFFERESTWREIREEAGDAEEAAGGKEDGRGEDDGEEDEDEGEGDSTPPAVHFEPIDARHLSSLSLIKTRVIKLLKQYKDHTYPVQNLVVSIVRPRVSMNAVLLIQK